MDDEVKERLVARFRVYLDSAEAVVATAAAEGSGATPDLFTLLAEVAALKSDVKLQSRQFKTALDELRALCDGRRGAAGGEAPEAAPVPGKAEEAGPDGGPAGDRAGDRAGDTTGVDTAEKQLVLELLELRDRMQAGHDQAARYRPARGGPGLGAGLGAGLGLGLGRGNTTAATRFVAAMAEGMAMNLERLDATLARRGVQPLPAVGERFDPHTMVAAEQARDPYRAEGDVVAELRKGFLYRGRLLRPAEVAVNRLAGRRDETSEEGRDAAYRARVFRRQWSQV